MSRKVSPGLGFRVRSLGPRHVCFLRSEAHMSRKVFPAAATSHDEASALVGVESSGGEGELSDFGQVKRVLLQIRGRGESRGAHTQYPIGNLGLRICTIDGRDVSNVCSDGGDEACKEEVESQTDDPNVLVLELEEDADDSRIEEKECGSQDQLTLSNRVRPRRPKNSDGLSRDDLIHHGLRHGHEIPRSGERKNPISPML